MKRCILILENLVVLIFVFAKASLATCPESCICRNAAPSRCPPGVSLIMDGCNCCTVCAKQLNEVCNDHDEPCDRHKRLFCKYSLSFQRGICKAQTGRPCVYEGQRVENGALLPTSCKQDCQCLDGSISCVMKCYDEHNPPSPDDCPNARLQSVEGRCCDEWVCDTRTGQRGLGSNFQSDISGSRDAPRPLVSDVQSLLTNKAYKDVVYEWDGGADGDELEDYQMGHSPLTASENDLSSWEETNNFPGEDDEDVSLERPRDCPRRASLWSSCSKSCGLGISTRVSNANVNCQLKRETRLCLTRECNAQQRSLPKRNRKHCVRQRTSRNRIRLSYAGCRSVKSYRPKFCGLCTDKCCEPRSTRNISIRFRCKTGRGFNMNFALIRSCRCSRRNCPSSSNGARSRSNSLSRDLRSRET